GDRLGAHAALEVVAVAVAQLAPQQLVLDDLAAVEVAELVERPLCQVDLGGRTVAHGVDVLLNHPAAGLQLGVLGPLRLELLELLLERLEPTVDVDVALTL